MNGLPSGVNLSPLTSRKLEQLRFGVHETQLVFDRDIRVVIECPCELRAPSRSAGRVENVNTIASELCKLLALQIANALRSSDGGLVVSFSNGWELELIRDSTEYECFQIHIGTELFVA